MADESLRLSEIRPIGRFLRLQERKTEGGMKTLDRQITVLLGNKSKCMFSVCVGILIHSGVSNISLQRIDVLRLKMPVV